MWKEETGLGQWSGGKKAEMPGMTKAWTLDSDGQGQVLAPALASQVHRLSRGINWSTSWVLGIGEDARDTVMSKTTLVPMLMEK